MRNSLSAAVAATTTTKDAGRLNAREAAWEGRDNGVPLEDVGHILLCRFGAIRPIYTIHHGVPGQGIGVRKQRGPPDR